jgi:hypothetical protein
MKDLEDRDGDRHGCPPQGSGLTDIGDVTGVEHRPSGGYDIADGGAGRDLT